MCKSIAISGLAALGLMVGLGVNKAHAQEGFYVGAAVGKASLELGDIGFGLNFDTSDTAIKIFGGYMFNEYFGLDAAYVDLGDQTENFGPFSITVDMSALSISLLGNLPLGKYFALFGKVGATSTQGDVVGRGSGLFSSRDGGEDNISYGFGAALRFGIPFEIRAEYDAVEISGGDLNYWTVGGLYRF